MRKEVAVQCGVHKTLVSRVVEIQRRLIAGVSADDTEVLSLEMVIGTNEINSALTTPFSLQVLRQVFEVLASVTARSPKCIKPVAALLQSVQTGTGQSHDVFATTLRFCDRNTIEVADVENGHNRWNDMDTCRQHCG